MNGSLASTAIAAYDQFIVVAIVLEFVNCGNAFKNRLATGCYLHRCRTVLFDFLKLARKPYKFIY